LQVNTSFCIQFNEITDFDVGGCILNVLRQFYFGSFSFIVTCTEVKPSEPSLFFFKGG
jgi:hypothetical protein